MTKTSLLYVVEIHGSNAFTPHAVCEDVTVEPGYRGLVSVVPDSPLAYQEGDDVEDVALFTDRDQADAVGIACRWNGQTYTVRAARGRVREHGTTISPTLIEWRSCQEV